MNDTRWKSCWEASPTIYNLLKENDTLEGARDELKNYLETLDWKYRFNYKEIKSWNYILLKEAIRCLKNIISPRNERLAKSKALSFLWKAAHDGDSEVTDDFIMEFKHIFKALFETSDVYPSWMMEKVESINFSKLSGLEAGKTRSNFLDDMSVQMNQYMSRYKSGLNKEIIEERRKHKMQILDELGGSVDDWNNYQWQYKHVFKAEEDLETIKKLIELTPEEERGIALAVANDVPFGITPHYLHLMDPKPTDLDFAIRRQVFPPLEYVKKMIQHKDDRSVFDFMREGDTSPEDHVTRRYPKVAILKPYDSCPQICTYCQRNWSIKSVFSPDALVQKEELEKAIDWFGEHDQIMDILITGGDPLVMSNTKINHILKRLAEFKHIQNIRIATRIPITVPQRLTDEICEIFGQYYEPGDRTLCMVTHFEHPYEVTRDTAEAIKKVKKQGLHIYNQQVFTFANSRRFETNALRIALKQIGVDPYYTFNAKGKGELESYSVPVARLLQERKEEARLLPGVFRSDEPVFNVPRLGKNHLRAWQDHEMIGIMPDGRRVYSFHPWEKNIEQVQPYIYTDVSIYQYLQRLKARGENVDHYKSIWYYF